MKRNENESKGYINVLVKYLTLQARCTSKFRCKLPGLSKDEMGIYGSRTMAHLAQASTSWLSLIGHVIKNKNNNISKVEFLLV